MSETDRERYREARAAGIAQHGDNVMLDTPCHAFLLWSAYMIVREAGRRHQHGIFIEHWTCGTCR